MTQEEKELLAKDICARLPYVIVHTWYNKPLDIKCTGIDLYTNTINLDIPDDDNAKVYIDNCKPYLRPMSSMTEEEREELSDYLCEQVMSNKIGITIPPNPTQGKGIPFIWMGDCMEWLNAHHFDYRGLIPMGLAIEAPEGMYKINTK